jgi:hypothetical protein
MLGIVPLSLLNGPVRFPCLNKQSSGYSRSSMMPHVFFEQSRNLQLWVTRPTDKFDGFNAFGGTFEVNFD